jgi:predicted phosphodiesterase
MKIAVIADAHANLPALKASLKAINVENCDAVYHVADAIAIGPTRRNASICCTRRPGYTVWLATMNVTL